MKLLVALLSLLALCLMLAAVPAAAKLSTTMARSMGTPMPEPSTSDGSRATALPCRAATAR